MSEKLNMVKVDTYGRVTETKIIKIPGGVNINPGDTITEKGRCIIVERKNYMCDIYLKKQSCDGIVTEVTEVIKDFKLNQNPSWEHPRIDYFNEVAFLNSSEWENKLINLSNGRVIAENTEKYLFCDVEDEICPIQKFGTHFYILKYRSTTTDVPNDIYILIDEHGNRILPANFVGKIKKAYTVGNILLLHYNNGRKHGMISVQVFGRNYIVKQIIKRKYDEELRINFKKFVKDVHGNIHYPCITGTIYDSERDITHFFNVTGQRIKV